MSIDQGVNFNQILISIIAFLAGTLQLVGLKWLSNLKSTDGEIFRRMNKTDRENSDRFAAIGERLATIEALLKKKR